MKKFKRAAIALAVAASVISPSGLNASAGTTRTITVGNGSKIVSSCSGGLVAQGTVGSGGRWKLFYNSAAGGTNCLQVFNTRGGTPRMIAGIYSTSGTRRMAWDEGTFKSYAGGSQITGTKGQCVALWVVYENRYQYIPRTACG